MSWNREAQAAEVFPPIFNQVAAINCSTTVQVIDLTTLPKCAALPGDQPVKNPVGSYVRITADGGNVYFVTGNNFALLNAIPNTVVYSTVNATTGAVSNFANIPDVIYSGAWKDFVVVPGITGSMGSSGAGSATPGYGKDSPCRYVALLTSTGNAAARIHQSSK